MVITPWLPPGEAKRRLRELIPFNVSILSGNGRWLRIPIIYKLFTHAIAAKIRLFYIPTLYNLKIRS